MLGPTPLRDISLVAGFELREMRRSRRALAVIALYLMVAASLTFLFVRLLEEAQAIATNPAAYVTGAGAPGPGGPPGPGGRGPRGPVFTAASIDKPSQGILFSRRSPFRNILNKQLADPATMDFLVVKPPIALFYLLTSFMFVPFIIMITAADTVAQEHQSRGVRFVAMRTGRAEFVLGKVLGQSLLMALVTLLGGLMCLTIAAWRLSDFEWGPALSALLLFWPRVVAYGLPFVALAALCSMSFTSVMAARSAAVIGLGAVWFVSHLSTVFPNSALVPVFDAVSFFTPQAHQDELWRPGWGAVGFQMMMLAGLAVAYVLGGLMFYRRKDL